MTDPAQERFDALFGPEFGHGKPFALAPLRETLAALDAPHTRLPRVIHVAGTNGKGSTIAFMRGVAEAAGLRIHAFTKPHLFRLNERFLIAGAPASDDALIDAAERVARISTALTQFDAQVAAAFLLFSETPADLVLLETGMGGRDDSTNVIERPALCVITPVGLDHRDELGPEFSDIARHKAGILKPNAPAIIAAQEDAAREAIEAEAQRIDAPLLRQGVEWDAYLSHGRLVVQTEQRALDLPTPGLYGPHQLGNAGAAVVAMLQLGAFEDTAFAAGVSWTHWPARLQPLTRGALSEPIRAKGGEVWVDGAHNEHAAAALARALEAMQRRRRAPTIVILGVRARKDAPGMVARLAPHATEIIGVPLAEDHTLTERIASFAEEFGAYGAHAASLSDAIARASHTVGARIVICGSFLLAAQALWLEGEPPLKL